MKDNLTPRQRRGVAALLTAKTVTAAADQAGVSERTINRWIKQPGFIRELRQAQAAIIDQLAGRLVAGTGQALDTLADLMQSAESESVRRQAAGQWLELCLTIREQTDLERRITELEKAATHDPNH